MLKTEQFISDITNRAQVSLEEARSFVEIFDKTVEKELAAGREVSVPGLGTFELVARKARTIRHPQTGEPLKVAAQTAIHFRPAPSFKRALNP